MNNIEMPEDRDDELEGRPSGAIPRILALVSVAVGLVLTIVWLLSGGGAEFFHKKFHLHTYLSDSGSIGKDADVILNGVRIGRVQQVSLADSLDPNRAVRVEMELERRYMDMIPVDSVAALTADNLVGDRYLAINEGKAADHVGDGAEIASLIQNGGFNPADLVSSLQITLQRVDAILNEIEVGDTPTSHFVRGDEFYQGLNSQMTALQHTVETYGNPKSDTGKLLFTPAAYDQIRQRFLSIDRSLEALQEGKTPAGKLLNDPGMYDRAVAQIHSVHESINNAAAGKGSAGQWLQSDAKYEQIRAKLQSLDHAIDQLTQGNGKFAQLLASEKLYDSLAKETGSKGTFLREFREDPQKFMRIKLFGKKKKPAPLLQPAAAPSHTP